MMKTGIVLPFPVYENAVSSAFFYLFIRGRWLANPKQDGNRWSQQVCKAILKRSNVNVCDEKDDLLDVADVILPVLFSGVQYSGEWSNAQSVWPIIWSAQHFCCAPHRSFSAGAVSDYQAPAKPQRVDSHISIGLGGSLRPPHLHRTTRPQDAQRRVAIIVTNVSWQRQFN